MITRISIGILLGFFPIFLGAQEDSTQAGRNIYILNPAHLATSFRHELGFTFGAHVFRSPDQAIHYTVKQGVAYPEPVFTRGISVMTVTYEPRLRLIEIGGAASFSLDAPLAAALSLIDVRTDDGFRYSTAPITSQQFRSGIYFNERGRNLGLFHVEAGGLLSLNLFQGATYENTSPIGFSVSGGVNYIVAPLVMNPLTDEEKDAYADFISWWTPVARFSFHMRGILCSYMVGVNPTRVTYPTLTSSRTTNTNTYNRFSIALRLGR